MLTDMLTRTLCLALLEHRGPAIGLMHRTAKEVARDGRLDNIIEQP